jgi:hypothetical protein
MADFLSGLSGLGLGKLDGMDLFGNEEKEKETAKKETPKAKTYSAPPVEEKDLIFDKTIKCPVCDNNFTAKIMKTGKARLIGTDYDLRPRHEGIDSVKYEVYLCPHCGYAALARYFPVIGTAQAKLIKEKISSDVKLKKYNDDIYTYEEALERYKLCLVNAVVKRAKTSEKAYICLKMAWLFRGYHDYMMADTHQSPEILVALMQEEQKYLTNAMTGFTEAMATEEFPMCGIDEHTMEYLLAQLYFHFGKYDESSQLISKLLTSRTAKESIKNKARDLKEQILAVRKA